MNRKSGVDHYAVLGVPQTATEAEIKKAFRKKSLKVHPDKNPSKDAAALFIKLKAAYDFLSDNSKRVQYDNEKKQEERDRARYAQFSAQYNNMSQKSTNQARKDDEEWDALNRGEKYYTQWIKNKFAAQQANRQQNKRQRRQMDESLLHQWQQDARDKHQRTMAKMKLMWDPNMRVAPRTIQNYLWAFAVNIPPGAPPGVAIAEFRNAREALNAERLCKRFKPRPLDVEWITPRPQTNYGPPGSYYDHQERQAPKTSTMNPDLEPEKDNGFGVGKTPNFADDDVIIIGEMGTCFGSKKKEKPIVIDDESPKVDEEIIIEDDPPTKNDTNFVDDDLDFIHQFRSKNSGKSKSSKKRPKSPEFLPQRSKSPEKSKIQDDDLDFIKQFRDKKKSENEKKFEDLLKKTKNDRKRERVKSPPKLDKSFEAELRRAKEKKAAEKLAEESAKKLKEEKMRKNADLFNKLSRGDDSRKKSKSSRTEVRSDFLDEMKKKAAEAKKVKEPPKSAERIKLDEIAETKKVKDLDKIDMRLLFSQKW